MAKCLGIANQIMKELMKSQLVYNKYKTCIHNAKSAFGHYEKYSSCFSIRSVDEEMLTIFRKVGLSYAKLMQVVTNSNQKTLNTTTAAADLVVTIDECEKLLKEKASFFNNIISFLERNERQIMAALGNQIHAKKISAELKTLEKNLTYANTLVSRMNIMLKSSQQIYLASHMTLKSA